STHITFDDDIRSDPACPINKWHKGSNDQSFL
ncbi:uncharacterized protein METZ01_LOCUS449359, partial [marine metagenome]